MRALSVLTLALLAGCGGSLDRAVEPLVTIDQGVYGQTTFVDDVGEPAPTANPMSLEVFTMPRTEGDAPVASTTSDDEHGFYEAALPAGDFSICTTFGRCWDFAVKDGEKVRLDYEMGPGPGWSEPATH